MALQSEKPRTGSHPPQQTLPPEEWYERVSRKASERYQLRGEEPGQDRDDWLAAARVGQQELRLGPPVPEPIREDDDTAEDNRVPP